MAVPGEQIGWSNESKLLRYILKQLDRLLRLVGSIPNAGNIEGVLVGDGVGGVAPAVSGTDIKTVNGETILGGGDITIVPGGFGCGDVPACEEDPVFSAWLNSTPPAYPGDIPTNTSELNNNSGFIVCADVPGCEEDPIVGAVNGIVVADGFGNIGAVISGTDIKTLNGNSILGAGNVTTDNINWQGAYNNGTSYLENDGVSYLGSSYICILATAPGGHLPTDGTYWGILAQMGDPGVSGVSGSLTTPFTAQTSVTVTHNFNAYPAVQVIDDNGKVIIPLEITHASTMAYTVTFTNSTSGNIVTTIGGVSTSVVIKSGDYTLTDSDDTVKVTAAATITLPPVTGRQGKTYNIKHMATTGINVIVEADGAETIDEVHSWTMNAKYTVMTVRCTGTEWLIL